MPTTFNVQTPDTEAFIEITSEVNKIIRDAKLSDGFVVVFVPHTTAGITINENADPDVRHDILMHLDKIIPQSRDFRHGEGNSPAHIKASLMGSSVTIMVFDGKMVLGTWQGIYLCEFDGPRNRRVMVKTMGA